MRKQYINPFALASTGEIEYVSMVTAFATEGTLELSFTAYLDKKSHDLAVDQVEIDALLNK